MRLNPCVENLSDMTPVEGGRFCASCAKTIVDLTNKTNDEIRTLYDENNGKLCGIVMPGQLQENRYYHPLKRFALALMIVFGTSLFVFANDNGFNQFRNQAYQQLKQDELKLTIEGFVYGNGGMPLAGAEVIAKVNGLDYVVYTDLDGKFMLEVPETNTGEIKMKFAYAGYKPEKKEFVIREGMTKLFAGKTNLELDYEKCVKGKIAPVEQPKEVKEKPIKTAGVVVPPPNEKIEHTKGEVVAPHNINNGGISPINDELQFD